MKRRNPFNDEPRQIVVPTFSAELSVLDCFDAIAGQAENSEMNNAFMEAFHPFIERVATALGLSHNQVVLLCGFLNEGRSSAGQTDLQRYFDCSSVRIIRMWDEVEGLYKKGYLELAEGRIGSTNSEYIMTEEGIQSLRKGEPLEKKTEKDLTNSQYVNKLRRIISIKRRSNISDQDFCNTVNELNEQNQHLTIAREICNSDLSLEGKTMLTFALNCTLLSNGDTLDCDDFERVFDEDAFGLHQSLVRGEHELIKEHYLQNANTDGMARRDVFELTDATRERFLKDFTFTTSGASDVTGLIQPDKISKKELFYTPEDNKQISSLSSLLTEEKIVAIRERLDKAGMRKGFCCLFYGAPGTGKTETALQLARQTGRAIMQVDFSQTRDMWYGNTEKNVKRIFSEYRHLAQSSTLLPILLFNEADAILSIRQNISGSNHSIDKTENAIQNIILQEMESFDGIMIATTNLTTNLDKAFERRFLYKVEFHKPTLEAKQHIWHAMLPNVEEDVLRRLAMSYDLTGGQIENVARKYMVNSILYGDVEDCYMSLSDFCHQETLSSTEGKKIGFV